MIHPLMNVDIIDINASKHNVCTIDNLYKHYIEHSQEINTDACISKINFSGMNIKITDWFGWTQLLLIEKISVDKMQWIKLDIQSEDIPSIGASIILSSETPVPSYNPYGPTKHFHGEIKYPFEIKPFGSFDNKDYLRILSMIPFKSKYSCNCGKLNGFHNKDHICEKCKSVVEYSDDKLNNEFWHPTSIEHGMSDKDYGYRIYTKSGFYNVNKFHMIVNDTKKKHIK